VKIVLDTNVFISGIFFSGPPFQILQAWKERKIQFVLSQEIVSEYQRVAEALANKYPIVDISGIIEMVTIYSEIVGTDGYEIFECEDPDDNKFVECAMAGNCKTIVSGDKHLLKLSGFQNINVLTPRKFVDLHLK
jgi:putative PIN family toxin of toxin-antitoxin system